RWRQVSLRPGEHPMAELQAVLGPGQDPVRSALAGTPAEKRLLVDIDQFEEAFTTCRDEAERDSFIQGLTRSALDEPEKVVVVPILRADFYGDCAAYPDFARLLADNHVPVGPMSKDELRRAIELPA